MSGGPQRPGTQVANPVVNRPKPYGQPGRRASQRAMQSQLKSLLRSGFLANSSYSLPLYLVSPAINTTTLNHHHTHGNKFKPQDRPNIPSCKEYTFHIPMVFTSWGKLDIEIQILVNITEFNAVIKKIYIHDL